MLKLIVPNVKLLTADLANFAPPRWIAYSHVDFSGHQYILEKGFYSCCSDWGSEDNRICSLQPILQVTGGDRLPV